MKQSPQRPYTKSRKQIRTNNRLRTMVNSTSLSLLSITLLSVLSFSLGRLKVRCSWPHRAAVSCRLSCSIIIVVVDTPSIDILPRAAIIGLWFSSLHMHWLCAHCTGVCGRGVLVVHVRRHRHCRHVGFPWKREVWNNSNPMYSK